MIKMFNKERSKDLFNKVWPTIEKEYETLSPVVKKRTKKLFRIAIFILVFGFAMIVFGYIGFSLEILALQIILYIGCFIVTGWIIRLSIPFKITKFGIKSTTLIKKLTDNVYVEYFKEQKSNLKLDSFQSYVVPLNLEITYKEYKNYLVTKDYSNIKHEIIKNLFVNEDIKRMAGFGSFVKFRFTIKANLQFSSNQHKTNMCQLMVHRVEKVGQSAGKSHNLRHINILCFKGIIINSQKQILSPYEIELISKDCKFNLHNKELKKPSIAMASEEFNSKIDYYVEVDDGAKLSRILQPRIMLEISNLKLLKKLNLLSGVNNKNTTLFFDLECLAPENYKGMLGQFFEGKAKAEILISEIFSTFIDLMEDFQKLETCGLLN